MRIAPTGLMPNVSGSKTEIVASGPMPGRTPTMLPTSTPTKHHMMFCGSKATPKPYQRSVRAVASISQSPTEWREGHFQHIGEQQGAGHRNAGSQHGRALPSRIAVAERGDEHAHEGGRDQAEQL